jgi:thioredoxin 1
MAGKNVVTLSDSSFDTEVLQSATPVMVDFWAEWCGPCKMLGPTIDQLADEYQGKVKIAKLNVDDNSSTASRFGIRGIPALLIFQGGQVKEQLVGALPKANISKALDKYVGVAAPVPVAAAPAPAPVKPVAVH